LGLLFEEPEEEAAVEVKKVEKVVEMVSVVEGPECKTCKQVVPTKCEDCGQNMPPKQVAVEKEV